MASQKLDLQLRGLYTSPNNLSAVPQGALEVADNVVIDKINIVESRRGQTQYGSPLSIGSTQVNKLFNYASSLILNYDNKMAYDAGSGNWTDYTGTYTAPSTDYKMRSLEAAKNFYFTTSKGIYKIDSLTSTPKPAGVVEALSGTSTLSGTGGFLVENTAVAYRLVWTYTDANGNLLQGAPSQRLIVANPSGSGNDYDVQLVYLIPDTITTDYKYQIYRSTATATATDEPNDELQLVLEGTPTSAEITAKLFTVTDITPYTLMRQTIYTAPSQQGIENANYTPPYAVDMDVFKNCAFYANVRQKQQATLTLISVGTPSFGFYTDATVGTTSGNTDLTTIASTADLRVGMRVVGAGIPTNTYIASILSGTSIRMTQQATATASVSVEFQDRLSFNNVDFWGGSANNASTNTFKVETTFTPGDNIDETALNLIQIVNTSTSNTTIYAYYLSGVGDLPGQLLFKERTLGGDEFYITSTEGSSFTPVLPVGNDITAISMADPTVITSIAHGLTSGDSIDIFDSNSTPSVDGTYTVTVLTSDTFTIDVEVTVAGTTGTFVKTSDAVHSDNDAKQNRVYASKPSQVEAVPLYTCLDIGSANFPIQRVVALRDGIFFFKQDGIFRLSGETFSSWTVSLVDSTTTLLVPESAVPFNNQVFCFADQGICAVTDSGVQIMSVPIEGTLLQLASEQYTHFNTASFGVAYESSRQYMFFTVTEEDDEFATQAFIYNSLTKTWTRWVMNRVCGVVNTSINKLFMAETDTGQVMIERKSFTNQDYADEQYDVTIASVDSATQMTLSDASAVTVGMTIVQGNRATVVTDKAVNVLTVVDTNGFTAAAAIVYTPILNTIQWAPIDAENPGILKQFSEVTFAFRNAAFREITASFGSNILNDTVTVDIVNNATQDGWGSFGWGSQSWGGILGGQIVLRTYVPRNQQRASWMYLGLSTQQAFTGFSLQGVSVVFNPMSTRFK